MNITKGKRKIPYRVVIYGPEGIGKTTLASKFPAPVFLDTEGSTERMGNVERFDRPETLEDVTACIDWLAQESHGYRTLVIDTMDRLELLINDKVCQEKGVTGLEDIGYGKGYTYVAEKANRLLGKLDTLRLAKNMHVVIVCHGQMRKFEQPDEMGAYDRWELKLSKKVAPMVKEWADMVLFANYKTYVVKTDAGNRKAQGGKRVMYSAHNPCWDAKNRDGLPEMMDFDFKPIARLFTEASEADGSRRKQEAEPEPEPERKQEPELKPEQEAKPETEPFGSMNETEKRLRQKMAEADVTEDQVMVTLHAKGKFGASYTLRDLDDWGFVEKNMLGNWESFLKAVRKYGGEVPFLNDKEDKK